MQNGNDLDLFISAVFQTDTKLVARVRLQNITPEMEQVFEQIHSYFHANLPGAGGSGPREASTIPAQQSAPQLKNNQRKKSGKSPGNLGSGVSVPPQRCQLTSAAAPPTKPAAQRFKGSCGGNKPRVELGPLENSLNCAELKNTLTPKKDLLSALHNLSSDDWYVLDGAPHLLPPAFSSMSVIKPKPKKSHLVFFILAVVAQVLWAQLSVTDWEFMVSMAITPHPLSDSVLKIVKT